MDLKQEILKFDDKHTDILESLSTKLSPEVSIISELLNIASEDDPKLQTGATWLLKRFQENGYSCQASQVEDCLSLLSQVTHWEARLHLLQMIPGFIIPISHKESLHTVLKDHLSNKNKFVRAWTYNSLAILAEQHAEYREEVSTLLAQGQREEAASIKARIRNIMKTTQWITQEE